MGGNEDWRTAQKRALCVQAEGFQSGRLSLTNMSTLRREVPVNGKLLSPAEYSVQGNLLTVPTSAFGEGTGAVNVEVRR